MVKKDLLSMAKDGRYLIPAFIPNLTNLIKKIIEGYWTCEFFFLNLSYLGTVWVPIIASTFFSKTRFRPFFFFFFSPVPIILFMGHE